jgi:hypothetical protein
MISISFFFNFTIVSANDWGLERDYFLYLKKKFKFLFEFNLWQVVKLALLSYWKRKQECNSYHLRIWKYRLNLNCIDPNVLQEKSWVEATNISDYTVDCFSFFSAIFVQTVYLRRPPWSKNCAKGRQIVFLTLATIIQCKWGRCRQYRTAQVEVLYGKSTHEICMAEAQYMFSCYCIL